MSVLKSKGQNNQILAIKKEETRLLEAKPDVEVRAWIRELGKTKEKVIQVVETYFSMLEAEYEKSLTALTKAINWENEFVGVNRQLQSVLIRAEAEEIPLREFEPMFNDIHSNVDTFVTRTSRYIPQMRIHRNFFVNLHNIMRDGVQLVKGDGSIYLNEVAGRTAMKQSTASPDSKQLVGVSWLSHNYFKEGSRWKTLHFFHDNDKKLTIFHIDRISAHLEHPESVSLPPFEEISLNIGYKIPLYHRSIVTPDGSIYITGGINRERNATCADVLLYNNDTRSLVVKPSMRDARHSHSIIFADGRIFVVGGASPNEGLLKTCEIFRPGSDGSWVSISPMNEAIAFAGLATFGHRYIFRFGGKTSGAELSNRVERYDIALDVWTLVPMSNNDYIPFGLLPAAVAYSQTEIAVFGGMGAETTGTLAFVCKIDSSERILDAHVKALTEFGQIPNAGGFLAPPIVENRFLWCLQNIHIDNSPATFNLSKRRVLLCDKGGWKEVLSPTSNY